MFILWLITANFHSHESIELNGNREIELRLKFSDQKRRENKNENENEKKLKIQFNLFPSIGTSLVSFWNDSKKRAKLKTKFKWSGIEDSYSKLNNFELTNEKPN